MSIVSKSVIIDMLQQTFSLCFMLSTWFVVNLGSFDLDNDTWVLYNMMGNVTELQTYYSWFDPNNPNPCNNWTFVVCDNNDKVIELSDFRGVGNYYNQEAINTTYWPQKIQSIKFHDVYFVGRLILDNLPNTTKKIDMYYTSLQFNFTDFPWLSHLDNLSYIRMIPAYTNYYYDNFFGILSNLQLKLPYHLESLYLYNIKMEPFVNLTDITGLKKLVFDSIDLPSDTYMDLKLPHSLQSLKIFNVKVKQFPDFAHSNQINQISFGNVTFEDECSFVETQLPFKLENLTIINSTLQGTLYFESLLGNSSHLMYSSV